MNRAMSSLRRYNLCVLTNERHCAQRFALTQVSRDHKQASIVPFEKLHGLGNDFIHIDLADLLAADAAAAAGTDKSLLRNWNSTRAPFARTLCDRNFGIGADGVIIGFSGNCLKDSRLKSTEISEMISTYPDASGCDIGWIYINSDGSISNMCGNGLRCLTLWATRKKLVANSPVVVSTAIGPVSVRSNEDDTFTVNIGRPRLAPQDIPLSGKHFTGDAKGPSVVSHPIEVGSDKLHVTCANVGNPHCVIFESSFSSDIAVSLKSARTAVPRSSFFAPRLADLAQRIQAMPLFNESANIEFAHVRSRDEIDVIVWERGCGPTLACSSGAAAALIAAVLEERTERNCKVNLPGGTVQVNWTVEDGSIEMRGPAQFVFAGTLDMNAVMQMVQDDTAPSVVGGSGKIEVTCS